MNSGLSASGASRGLATAGSDAASVSAEEVQDLMDRAAHCNMFSMPDRSVSHSSIVAPGTSNSVIGLRINEDLHRFVIAGQPPTIQAPLRARNIVGQRIGKFTHRWLMMPDDFVALPDREPPATPIDLSRRQRFVMLDGRCTF